MPPRPVVLCVDDDPDMLASVARLLRRDAYEVVIANTPAEALATLRLGYELADKVGQEGSRTAVLEINPPPEKQAGEIIEDEDTNDTVEKIVAWLDERKLI